MNKQQPIRVAHVIGKMVGGGVESVVMNYYRNIDKEKVQFDFIIDSDSTVVPKEEIEKLGGRIIEVPPYQKILNYIKELKKVFKDGEYKIVHSHLNSLSVFPLFVAFLSKIPIRIAHSHSTTNKKEWKKNILKTILRPFSKVFATDFFACTEHAGKWLFGENVLKKGQITILNNAIDVEKFKYNKNVRKNIRNELKIEDKFVIGHVGRFVQQKNHDFLIDVFNECFKENKNVILMLIGEGPLENNIRNKVKKLNIEDKVIFMGVRNDVNQLMQAMDIFVFPSLYEGLGIVAIEAQCSNLNVICSEEVPKDVKLTECVKFCKFDNIEVWKELILNCNLERKDCSVEVRNKRYDINYEVQVYQEKIINLYNERINR